MTTLRTQTSFTAGEIDPLLAGRLDIRAASEGCRTLRNLLVQPSGGVTRRPGTRIVCALQGAGRLIALDRSAGPAIAALSHGRIEIVEGGTVTASLAAPWTAAQIPVVRWTHRRDALLLSHPDVEPQELLRPAGEAWSLRAIPFATVPGASGLPLSRKPFFRFAGSQVSIQPSFGGQDAALPIAPNQTVLVRTSHPVFVAGHYGTRLRVRGRQLTITSVASSSQVTARSDEELLDGQATYDWQEEAFSSAHGWPVALALHQDRLVIGGSRDLRDRLWLSRTGNHFDFDPGSGLDDEGIGFALTADRRHEITAVVPSRQLQVLTTAGEWVVRGSPMTPGNIQVELQTGIGMARDGHVPPLAIDGATLFVGATGRELREFLFTDAEQAYQAADLAVLCRHLLLAPVDMAFDPGRRLLAILRADGKLATVTLDRTSNIAAWSLQETVGRFTGVTAIGGELYLATELAGRSQLERLETGLQLDHAITLTSATPRSSWTGLAALQGQTVTVLIGDRIVSEAIVSGTTLTTPEPATSITCGTRFAHTVEALPLSLAGAGGTGLDGRYRVLEVTFRTLATPVVKADAGNGYRTLAGNGAACADLTLGALGWRRPLDGPPWRIQQSDPSPFTLLATTLELKVTI